MIQNGVNKALRSAVLATAGTVRSDGSLLRDDIERGISFLLQDIPREILPTELGIDEAYIIAPTSIATNILEPYVSESGKARRHLRILGIR